MPCGACHPPAGAKLDRLVAQLSADNLASSIDSDFEDSLDRLTTAVKVLYGSNVIVVDDLLETREWQKMSSVVQIQRQRQIGQVFALYNQVSQSLDHSIIVNHHCTASSKLVLGCHSSCHCSASPALCSVQPCVVPCPV